MKPATKSKLGFWAILIRTINIFVLLALLFSILGCFVSPETNWYLAFFAIAHPYIALLNFFFVVYWILMKKRFLWIPLVSMVFALPITARTFNLGNHNGETPEDNFKVMTYNVHVFDRYDAKFEEAGQARDSILSYVKSESPDVVCFQEFFSSDKKNEKNLKLFQKNLQMDTFVNVRYSDTKARNFYLVIFSRFPIISSGVVEGIKDSTVNFGVYADIQLDGKKIRVYSIHLQSIKLYTEQNLFTENYKMSDKEDAKLVAKGTEKIARKMKRAYIQRAKQIDILARHIKASPYPVIVCGDFNDTPTSYSYTKISKGKKDAFLESGFGMGNTYNGPFPSFRIDHILHHPKLKAYEYSIGKIDYSDHFPVSCYFSFKEDE